ncbi:Velvet factor [Penicillium atrosanguineum]|nr:Velvet factor [Penicillium atrosanguineum]
MASRPPMMPPHNETEHSVSRITREGKQITYKLSVMQQPERARACGAGAKSSADRRPVDPPPVVELRIFESDPNNEAQKTDITFAYNANFFLYATLDTARPIAHGRVAGPPSCPVLTGVPVAGVAYLDRPSQAGYFIFPDLSVRHEGRYRLSFHLYEEIKDAKDADKNSTLPNPNQITHPTSSKPGSPQAFLHFRLEVKSVPFTVYSAKKFPGLATSTSLSRIIAEQGCRVRIRRDVRMRRRGEKREEDYDYDEERAAVYARSDRYSTPDRYAVATVERPRSNSNGSTMQSPYGFPPEIQRRPSAPDYGFQCPPQPYETVDATCPYGARSNALLSIPPVFWLNTCSLPFRPHAPPHHHRLHRPASVSEYEGTPAGYPMAPPMADRAGGYPKNPMASYRMEAPKLQSYMDPRIPPDPSPYQQMPPSMLPRAEPPALPHSLPPLKGLPNEYVQPTIEPGSPTGYDSVSGKRMLYQTGTTAVGKRSHEDSFGLDERSMQNGMRPDVPTYNSAYRDFSSESRAALMAELGGGFEMAYKRANGRMVMKVPPGKQ